MEALDAIGRIQYCAAELAGHDLLTPGILIGFSR